VYLAEQMAKHLRAKEGVEVVLRHIELEKMELEKMQPEKPGLEKTGR
jgi:hypothetical protein